MSKEWLNIRFGNYHLQCGEFAWYSLRISFNSSHMRNPKRFEIYKLFRYKWGLQRNECLREELSELSHKQWTGWMEYLFGKCKRNPSGHMEIPKWAIERWVRQIHTAYKDLPEEEKEEDRKEADKILAVINKEKG